MSSRTTPFASAEKTEDKFFCRDCGIHDLADIVADVTTCAWCDSQNIITSERRSRELNAEREETFARMDELDAASRDVGNEPGFMRVRQAS